MFRSDLCRGAIVPQRRRADRQDDPVWMRERTLCDAVEVHGKLAGWRQHWKRRDPIAQLHQGHVVFESAVPFRVVDELVNGVLGVADPNVKSSGYRSRRGNRSRGSYDPLCSEISAQSLWIACAPIVQRRVSARGCGWRSDEGKNGPLNTTVAASTNKAGVKQASDNETR